jgi:hypothetical protein
LDYGKFREISRNAQPSKPRKRPSNAKLLTEGREK